jgi:hypothetical protein
LLSPRFEYHPNNDFYENKKQEIGSLLNLTKQTKNQHPQKMKFWEDDRNKYTLIPALKLTHNINQRFNEIDSKNAKRIVFNKTTDGWNKLNKYY